MIIEGASCLGIQPKWTIVLPGGDEGLNCDSQKGSRKGLKWTSLLGKSYDDTLSGSSQPKECATHLH